MGTQGSYSTISLDGLICLDYDNACLWRGEQRIKLKAKTFSVLRYLAAHQGRIVAKEELLQAVWPGIVVSDWVLTTCVREIRRALGDNAKTPHWIETVHRRGYRLLSPFATAPPVLSGQWSVPSTDQAGAKNPQLATDHWRPTTKLVGREAELARLQELFAKAANGEPQFVFVTGEPGIGKTALIEAFRQRLETRGWKLAPSSQASSLQPLAPGVWLGWGQCIEQFGEGEAYLPLLTALSQLGQEAEGQRLIKLLKHHAPTWLLQLPALLKDEDLPLLQQRTTAATRERMVRELAEMVEALSTERLLVLVLEDLHWSDHATLNWLSFMARRRQRARLLVLVTYRPVEILGSTHPLRSVLQELLSHQLGTELPLHGLSEVEVQTFVDLRFPVSILPTRLARVLHQQTGGNPLFLVSLIRDLIAHGRILFQDGQWGFTGADELTALDAPDNIRQLVARQRERLSSIEQQVLAAASVAGVEFPTAAVAAALAMDRAVVEDHCQQLAERQYFLRRAGIYKWLDGTRSARYAFVHALYQSIWHEQVTIERLQQWHQRIGRYKERVYGRRVSEIAAELAVHFEQGRNVSKAVDYYELAGQNAMRRFAPHEAIRCLHKGIQLLQTLPETPERKEQELRCQMALHVPLILARGYTTSEVEQVCTRARALCQQLGDTAHLGQVTLALHRFYIVRAEVLRAHDLAEQLMRFAAEGCDQDLVLASHVALGTSWLYRGEFLMAQEHLVQAQRLYDPRRHHAFLLQFGEDSFVASAVFEALVLWHLGYPDQAVRKIQLTLVFAREQAYPYSLGFVLSLAGVISQLCRKEKAAWEQGEQALALGKEHDIPLLLVMGLIIGGWALAQQGQTEQGIARIQQSLHIWQAIGAKLQRPYFLTLLAEAYEKAGQIASGLDAVGEALQMVNTTEQHWYEAELYRLKGTLLLAQLAGSDSKRQG
jgi:DNA-binding winged helix-turn-helix (wHTH) protein/predicted ATPase